MEVVVLRLSLSTESRVTATERDFINKAASCAQPAAREGRRVIEFRVGEPEVQETAQCDFQDIFHPSLLLPAGPCHPAAGQEQVLLSPLHPCSIKAAILSFQKERNSFLPLPSEREQQPKLPWLFPPLSQRSSPQEYVIFPLLFIKYSFHRGVP